MLIDVATAREASDGDAPGAGIGAAGFDVGGDGAAGPEPDGDRLGGYFCGNDAALSHVEGDAEAVCCGGLDAAAFVFALGFIGYVAVGSI